jgi:hypothetical protein
MTPVLDLSLTGGISQPIDGNNTALMERGEATMKLPLSIFACAPGLSFGRT